MKKLVLILGASILLTGCSSSYVNINSKGIHIEDSTFKEYSIQEVTAKEYSKSKDIYIDDDMKKVIVDINNLRDKHKDTIDERGFDSLYIDLDNRNSERIDDIVFSNNEFYGEEYFNDLVKILDENVAEGLEEFVGNMKDKNLQGNDYSPREIIIEKIGKTLVYVQDRGGGDNYISVKINFFHVGNEYYREIFNNISDEKYILDNVISGEDLNLIEFISANHSYGYYNDEEIKIRYDMFFADENIEKVNILLQGKNGVDFKDEDIGVFINLLNSMDLNEKDKDILVHEYKNVFKSNVNKKKISLDNYELYINYKKGNSNSGGVWELRYFSIERK